MKKRLLCLILACLLLTTGVLAYGSGTGEAVYVNRWSLASGFTYENAFSYNASGSRNETFLVENKPGSSIYPIVLACDTIYGGMTITQMISYAEGLGYNVVGAINADFGYWETRIQAGSLHNASERHAGHLGHDDAPEQDPRGQRGVSVQRVFLHGLDPHLDLRLVRAAEGALGRDHA